MKLSKSGMPVLFGSSDRLLCAMLIDLMTEV